MAQESWTARVGAVFKRSQQGFYLRLPECILLFIEALGLSLYSAETLEVWRFLEQLQKEVKCADCIIKGEAKWTLKELQAFNQKNISTYFILPSIFT